jgi:hypothetical protein
LRTRNYILNIESIGFGCLKEIVALFNPVVSVFSGRVSLSPLVFAGGIATIMNFRGRLCVSVLVSGGSGVTLFLFLLGQHNVRCPSVALMVFDVPLQPRRVILNEDQEMTLRQSDGSSRKQNA